MRSLGLVAQVLTIGLSVAIGILYIQPTFEEVSVIQDEVEVYKNQRVQVESVNADLARHVATLSSIDPTDIQRLTTYMPRFVDEIAVMRDLQFIIEEAGLVFEAVTYNGLSTELSDTEQNRLDAIGHDFSVSFEGTYSQVKDFFSLLEQNEYPLEVFEVDISALEGGFLSVTARILTYEDDLVPLDNN